MLFTLEQFFKLNFRVGIVEADVNDPHVALTVNDNLCRFFDRSREELMRPGIFASISDPDDLEREEPMMRALLGGERDNYGLVKRYTRPDGETIRGYVNVELIRDEGGDPAKTVGMVVEVRDLDDLRDLLLQRQLLAQALVEADTKLALAALRITEEEHVTRRKLAHDLGVGISTVQGWIDRGRRLR